MLKILDTDNIEVLVFTEDEDKEIDEYILSKDETMRKAKIWLKANADWLKGQRLKEIRKREEQEDRDANPHYKERKLKKRTQKSVEPIEANSISEALTAIIKEKKLTTKLNTDLLKSIDDVLPTIEKTSTDIDENQKLNLNLSDAIVVEDSEMHVAEQPHDEDIKDDDIDEDEEEEDDEDDDLLKGFRGNIGDAETDDEY
ncbi:hypothetical protein GJ496_011556 [Pomphorhynchus laevis]|nr:hypothetical protein GJ496_011556 [Pomphorhynchus laevis]